MSPTVAPASPRRAGARALLPWVLLLIAIADWLLLRYGLLSHPSWILTAVVGGTVALLLWQLGGVLRRVRSGAISRAAAVGPALALTGILLALGAGLTNWLLRLEGFVILQEGERVSLELGAELQHFEAGPLARLDEMELVVGLEELELQPAAAGFFYPESRLVVSRGDGGPERVDLHPRQSGAVGELRFFQGAFGFAPRIVILRDSETVFDRVVPFTTERRAESGISFDGEFTLAAEALRVVGSLDLASLDEGLKGHATLHLTVHRDGELIGRGSLLPGRFAEIDQGYRVGFAGLQKWSEVDISRRHYGGAMMAGLALSVLGAALAGAAAWRGW